MRSVIGLTLIALTVGCSRISLDSHLNDAYRAYHEGDCSRVMLELSQAERASRSRSYIQPEISLLRGQCLERESLFVDAVQTYQFILSRYPDSEYAFRAKARLHTLEQRGHVPAAPAVLPRKG